MSPALFVVAVALIASCASPTRPDSRAEEKGDISPGPLVHRLGPQEVEFGKTFLPLARQFGFSQFSYAARAANGGVLYEYLPAGETVDAWHRLGSLFIFKVGQSSEDAASILPKYAELLRSGLPEVHDAELLPGSSGGVFFIHYSIGGGAIREEGLSAVWVLLPGYLAIFQAMSRGEPYSEQQVGHFKSIAAQLAKPRGQ